MTAFRHYDAPEVGFAVVAGPDEGLQDFVVAAGHLPGGDHGPRHLHHGDEVLRILTGSIEVTVDTQTRICGPGDVVVVPADTVHGFTTLGAVELEVVSARDAGQLFPVVGADGDVELVEVYRRDLPWGRRPPPGFDWTSDERMQSILGSAPPAG